MPSLGADMEAGTLVEWLVKPGDRVKPGDIVAVVETQKGAIEIEIFEAGKIEQLLVGVDTKVPVGTPLARIQTEPEGPPGAVAAAPPPAAPAVPLATPPLVRAPVTPPSPPPVSPAAAARARVSPAARRLAEACGIDLSTVSGSGPAGAIVYADVERRLGEAVAPPERKRAPGLDLDAMRSAIAAAMARSKREIPHYYLAHDVDVTACVQWLTRTNAARPPDDRLLIGALAIKALALAARRFPAFNGFYRDGKFEPASAVHVGVAIAIRGGGLAAPALHQADRTSVDELMARMRDLVQRTRAGRIRSSEFSDPTITVTSLGERGVETLYGIIYPPQVAIVGIGKMVTRPWVIDGAIGPRSVVTITLSADHRVSDGHAGALFLAEIGRLLQEPDKL
ncbi:dihydrolipoamide acetyltransferase family protein [Bradyrhizobium sp. AUGA SZCCT0283]|uniref:dihydrolipoamide acetyltransferase family protein n=1 Tax=Bradyrhizobium sp. AUGA SZCCT0283 TaxID=2807671 RepID=UPI001BA54B87|nr:dihydrolipoamide acetyltransferase family protein [Bradyrhizobium sp. AUGA SZCCT0283]MBR1279221.1 2-oxo acid dehydrogenase subunit E2 [Bradyrhizobium sp. AUGA SZCCT0283]